MSEESFKISTKKLNKKEQFYKEYYHAKREEDTLDKFLANLDMEFVLENNLLIPEVDKTLPQKLGQLVYLDVNNANDAKGIGTVVHDRYTPAIRHVHDFVELSYVYSGKCKQTIDMETILLKKGDICVIAPDVEHSLEVFDNTILFKTLIRKSALDEISFNFLDSKNIISEYIHSIVHSYEVYDYLIFNTGSDKVIRNKFLFMLQESLCKDRFHHQMITNTLMLVFGFLIRNYENTVQLPKSKNKSDASRYEIMKIIQEDYINITLDDIAEKLNFSKDYTSRYIKKITGKNLSDIQKFIKLEKSKTLLKNTNMTIADISIKVGFNSTEYFIRSFKHSYNQTPSQFRKSNEI